MSGRRIVEETPCDHGAVADNCRYRSRPWQCPGGSRRVLTEGQYVLIEKEEGRWPDWVFVGLGWELDESHDLNTVMDGLWRERPR